MPVLTHLSLPELAWVICRTRPAWSYWRRVLAGGNVRVRRVRWNDLRGCLRSDDGCVGALKMLIAGGLRHISVTRGEVIWKSGSVVVETGGEMLISWMKDYWIATLMAW